MKEITLTQGKTALVDDSDYEYLNQFRWCVTIRNKTSYAIRRKGCKPGIIIYMHREVLGLTDPKIFVDHKDRDGLNNQRENLRVATKSQNSMNGSIRKNKTSKYRGVRLFKERGKWVSAIWVNGKLKHLGIFKSEIDAAVVYNNAAKELFGEFANLNNIAV